MVTVTAEGRGEFEVELGPRRQFKYRWRGDEDGFWMLDAIDTYTREPIPVRRISPPVPVPATRWTSDPAQPSWWSTTVKPHDDSAVMP